MLEQIGAGGEIGREAQREAFPRRIQLQRGASGRYFVAVFEDGVQGLLWDFHAASLAAFTAAGVEITW